MSSPKNEITVLYCEDSLFIAEAVTALLHTHFPKQLNIIRKFNQIEGLAHLEISKQQPDLIISDLKMSNHLYDGLDFFHSIRNKGNQIPFILFTSSYQDEFTFPERAEKFYWIHKVQGFSKLTMLIARLFPFLHHTV